MVTIDLRKTEPEDVRLIRELQSAGLPDSLIQVAYEETVRRREDVEAVNELERRALLGDRQAQEELTWHGKLLLCPCCKDVPDCWESGNGGVVECTGCGLQMRESSLERAIKLWNARAAPPIGRCKDCKSFGHEISDGKHSCTCLQLPYCNPNDFCSYFEPRE